MLVWPNHIIFSLRVFRWYNWRLHCRVLPHSTADTMVRAWYMDESDDDQRLPHMLEPNQEVNMDDLNRLCGLSYWKVSYRHLRNNISDTTTVFCALTQQWRCTQAGFSRVVLSEAVDSCICFTQKIQHGGDWQRSRPQWPKNVHNFLMTVRPLSWACGHGT